MNLKLNLKMENKKDEKKLERVKAAETKKAKAQYEPTWEEVWEKGWTSHTGSVKKSIFQSKLTDGDKLKLMEVKAAIENGELGSQVESLKKFSKSHALGLYKVLNGLRREKYIAEMIEHKPENYILITAEDSLIKLVNDLNNEKIIGLDTETTGVDYDKDYIVGISITLPRADYHVYIPIRHELDELQLDADLVLEALKFHLENKELGKVLHNAKFDFHMFANEGIWVAGLVMDTMVAMHILNENELSFALKNLATKYGKFFGFEDKSRTYEELFGKGGFEKTPLDIGTVYACKDTHLCYQFYLWIDDNLKKRPGLHHIYYDIENPLLEVSFHMERSGFLIDLDFADTYKGALKTRISELEVRLKEVFGDININSNQQLAEVLYDKMGLKDVSKNRSVDADNIKALANQNPDIKVLLEYREVNKLLTTYIEPLPLKIWGRDGRLHGSFQQTATVTGRYASNSPNLQNLPPDARKMFIAPKGKVLLGKDFSQIEPRMLAFLSDDKEFQVPYLTGTDLYATLASKVFHKPIEECGDGTKYRKMMKVGLLATMYGTSTYTLAQQLGITLEEAEQFIEDFLNTYPEARDYMQSLRDLADENQFVETLHGRKRRFIGHKVVAIKYKQVCAKIENTLGYVPKNIWAEKKLSRALKQAYWEVAKEYGRVARQSVNAVIQGSAADVMKLAMISVYEFLKSKGPDWKLLATVHDEIILEVPDTITEEDLAELDRRMTIVDKFSFPVKTDSVIMTRWGEEVPFRKWLDNGRKIA